MGTHINRYQSNTQTKREKSRHGKSPSICPVSAHEGTSVLSLPQRLEHEFAFVRRRKTERKQGKQRNRREKSLIKY